jgi:hypothetical protein
MDYEFRIKLLETETAHLKEMQQLLGAHQAITDTRLEHWERIIGGLVELSKENTTQIAANTVQIASLAAKLDKLVEALLREPRNGKARPKRLTNDQ